MKEKFKSYSFWMSVTAAVILVINNIGKTFGFEVDGEVVTKIVDSICGVLILFGVITMAKNDKKDEDVKNNVDEFECDEKSKISNNDNLNSQSKNKFDIKTNAFENNDENKLD